MKIVTGILEEHEEQILGEMLWKSELGKNIRHEIIFAGPGVKTHFGAELGTRVSSILSKGESIILRTLCVNHCYSTENALGKKNGACTYATRHTTLHRQSIGNPPHKFEQGSAWPTVNLLRILQILTKIAIFMGKWTLAELEKQQNLKFGDFHLIFWSFFCSGLSGTYDFS